MTNYKRQFISAVSAGVMLLNIATPALASTTIEISGNGAGSDNFTTVTSVNTSQISQSNTATVNNNVDVDADTGDNDANFNTGGSVGIQTGNANVTANVSNALNSNSANIDCCAAQNTDVKISGNGAGSLNTVGLTDVNTNAILQTNAATVNNTVDVDADTGDNDANLNTGGDVVIKTGSAKVNVDVSTKANVNSATIGGGMSVVPTPTASFIISGNGAGSDNFITAALVNATTVGQTNSANVNNNVDVDADTGDNEANFNTGGDVVIWTGNAEANVDVDNMVNFNHADVDCGCVLDVLAKIAGNGAELGGGIGLDNVITLTLTDAQSIGQGNGTTLNNDVDVDDAETGDNDASLNTGTPDSDPAIVTGNATSNVDVNNSGNVNSVGSLPLNWPTMPSMPNVTVSFNVAALLAFFGLSI